MISVMTIPANSDSPVTMALTDGRLESTQEFVGGYIEALTLRSMSHAGVTMYLNEEGKIHGLPLNTRATTLADRFAPGFKGQDVIVGDVVLMGGPDDEGNDTSLDKYALAMLEQVLDLILL